MNQQIRFGKYRHYKGNEYEVIGIARHSETLEEMMVYRSVKNPKEIWARPLVMFSEKVIVNGKQIPRFEFLEK